MDVGELEDVFLAANAEVDTIFAEIVTTFYKPHARTFMGMAAANMTLDQVRNIPPGGIDRIVKFALGEGENYGNR